MKAYIAAPFFNEKQVESVEKIKDCLIMQEYDFFSPKDHNPITPNASYLIQKKGFEENVAAINGSDVMIAITDGKDMGTLFECGYAFCKKVPIIYVAFSLGNNPFNLMLAHSSYAVCKNMDEVVVALERLEEKKDGEKYVGNIE